MPVFGSARNAWVPSGRAASTAGPHASLPMHIGTATSDVALQSISFRAHRSASAHAVSPARDVMSAPFPAFAWYTHRPMSSPSLAAGFTNTSAHGVPSVPASSHAFHLQVARAYTLQSSG